MTDVDPGPPIFTAVRAFDVEALRRELAAGVDPDMREHDSGSGCTPLYYAACWSGYPEEQVRERLECISALLEAGASVDKLVCGATPLYHLVGIPSPECHVVVAALVEAGADVNRANHTGFSVLAGAAASGTAAVVRTLISAGALDLGALNVAIMFGKPRSCTPLLRAGAALPAYTDTPYAPHNRAYVEPYIEKVRAAGGYKAYEKAHRQRLVAIFLPKFPTLPVEMLGRVLEFTWDIGGH